MPKEIINSADGHYLLTADGNEYPEGDEPNGASGQYRQRGVHVGWVKGASVEIGVASFDIARQQPADGVFVSLDRDGLNRLIRAARRARDQAFGADA